MPGNLASEQVTKRDVFHIFHHYGKIAQISIKQAYGFVQYYSAEACQQALLSQEGTELRGKKIRESFHPYCHVLADLYRSRGLKTTEISTT